MSDACFESLIHNQSIINRQRRATDEGKGNLRCDGLLSLEHSQMVAELLERRQGVSRSHGAFHSGESELGISRPDRLDCDLC
jgi:hypothetical protein